MDDVRQTVFRPYALGFWRAYLVHMRPYLLYVSGAIGWAGLALGGHSDTMLTVAVFTASFLGYGFGQALTDTTQVDTDTISSPYRPLSQRIIAPRDVAIVSTVGLICTATVLVIGNPWNIMLGVASIVGLSTYTFFKRSWWWSGPIWNSMIVALLPAMTWLALSPHRAPNDLDHSALLLMLAGGVAYASFVLIGYLKDISADRETGYKTFPVVFGYRRTVVLGDLQQLVASILYAVLLISIADNWYSWVLWSGGSIAAVVGQRSLPRRDDATEEEASAGIAATVRSFVLWNVAVVAAARPEWWWLTMPFLVAFEVTLRHRPESSQI